MAKCKALTGSALKGLMTETISESRTKQQKTSAAVYRISRHIFIPHLTTAMM